MLGGDATLGIMDWHSVCTAGAQLLVSRLAGLEPPVNRSSLGVTLPTNCPIFTREVVCNP